MPRPAATATATATAAATATATATQRTRRPAYVALLRLQHVRPNTVQRSLLAEGSILGAGLLVLADVASGWALLVLPVAVAAVVKVHDVVAGCLVPDAGPPAS